MGGYILIESFIVVVVGGLGSFAGAFVAAIVIGQVHNLGLVYVPWAATMIPFLLMVGGADLAPDRHRREPCLTMTNTEAGRRTAPTPFAAAAPRACGCAVAIVRDRCSAR